jgi:hypothetical protein
MFLCGSKKFLNKVIDFQLERPKTHVILKHFHMKLIIFGMLFLLSARAVAQNIPPADSAKNSLKFM